jgi:hypothetical protein
VAATASDTTHAGLATSLAVPTRVRWTMVAPTLLIVWIMSMFDKSNISIVINDPEFLAEMGLKGQQQLLGWLATGLLVAYGITARPGAGRSTGSGRGACARRAS